MAELRITRGLQGSGKTTHARKWVAESPESRARVNRDDLRQLMHRGYHGFSTEKQVTTAQHSMISGLLQSGWDVICDDTNLNQRTARDLRRIAVLTGSTFVVDDFTHVPLETCIKQDAQRVGIGYIGAKIIEETYNRYLRGKQIPLPFPEDADDDSDAVVPYEQPQFSATRVIIVDIDGTVALHNGLRDPFDFTKVHLDKPNAPVIAAVEAMYMSGCTVIFCSGRKDSCRAETEAWLYRHVRVNFNALHMRDAQDNRKDSIVKMEIFNV